MGRRNSDRSIHRYTNAILAIMFASVLLLVTTTSSRSVYAAHLGTSSDVWGIDAANIAKILHFDHNTDTTNTVPRVPSLSMENGRGMASDGTNLWYTILIQGFRGDGKIHKIAPTGGPDIATIPDPFGFNGSGINALDFDSSGNLWAISNYPIQLPTDPDPRAKIMKIDSNTGAVLASCDAPYRNSGPMGALAVVNGKILTRTDGHMNHVHEYNAPSSIGGNCVPTGAIFTLPVSSVTGIDTDRAGNLLVTDERNLYNLGHAPYSTVLSLQPNAFYPLWEMDITTKPELNVPTSVCPEENVQHWDKIVFMITDPALASKVNVTVNTELDIKALDDPQKVADLKQKVLNFLNTPNGNKNAIKIIDVEYAIICAALPPPSKEVVPPEFPNENSPSTAAKANQSSTLDGRDMNMTSKLSS